MQRSSHYSSHTPGCRYKAPRRSRVLPGAERAEGSGYAPAMHAASLPLSGMSPASRLGQLSWALFDWAGQPFFTLVTTFIFAPYFAVTVAGDAVLGQSLWGYTQAAAAFVVALLAPVLGAMADASGPRKPWTIGFVLLCAAGSTALWWAVPGLQGIGLAAILVAVALATIGIECGIVFNNAMLPSLVPAARIGRLSGFGWGLGYAGGLVALFMVLFALILPETSAFGLSKARYEPERLMGPFSAAWLLVFCLPLLFFTPDAPASGISRSAAVREGLRKIWATLRGLHHHRNITRYLIARMLYNDGIIAVIGFAGIYAKGMFGWSTTELGIFAILLTAIAILGSFLGGRMDDRAGSRRTILYMIGCLAVGTLGILSVTPDRILFLVPLATPPAGAGFLATPAQWVFLAFGLVVGFAFGPAQAVSRTLMARLSPPTQMAEFYGLFALSGKATAFLAPLLIAVVTDATSSQRAGFAVVLVLFVAGFLLLLPVREERA